ncbi:MAG: hypothetical protein AB7O24_12545 [Kofleriaceae bacterium]
MGAQRILQAAAVVVCIAHGVATAAPGKAERSTRERTAIIDLGPADRTIRTRINAAVAGAGLAPISGDGLEDALAGERGDRDGAALNASISAAERAFGALDCTVATAESTKAIGIAAARQAAGIAVPELQRALTYLLLCADRSGDVDGAMRAASQLRRLGAATAVPPDLSRKYPAVDTTLHSDRIPVEITAEVAGAEIWIDFQRAGTSPVRALLSTGPHVIAAAAGDRRGWAAGTAVTTQTALTVAMIDQGGPWSSVGARVASWNGAMPAAWELGWVMTEANARVAVVRHGTTIEVWGRPGGKDAPYRLGGEDGIGTIDEVDRMLALVVDRVNAWNDRAPDPDQPLLVETAAERAKRTGVAEEPTKWWVYATIVGALAAGAAVVYAHDSSNDIQRVELRVP